jgi:hypothetical protein
MLTITPVIEEKGHKVVKVSTTNTQYGYDEKDKLYGILEQEFGYRDPLPLAVAKLCKEYQTESGNQSLLWIGSGTGRGPVQLHNVFHNVSVFYTCSSNSNVWNRISGVMVSMQTTHYIMTRTSDIR